MNMPMRRKAGAFTSNITFSRHALIGVTLGIALIAFEIFNFDTTQYALVNLLGDVSFLGLKWAAILATAFCAIDFAGLARIFTPEKGWDEPKEVWYLMGAWLLGATMNAIMTWWAVSLTLLQHDFGNEVLSRAQLLKYVPIFVAVLVWLTRILFIGALSVAGDHLFDDVRPAPQPSRQPQRAQHQQAAIQQPARQQQRQPQRQQRSRQAATLTPSGGRHRPQRQTKPVGEPPVFVPAPPKPAPSRPKMASQRTNTRRPIRPTPNRRTGTTVPQTTYRQVPMMGQSANQGGFDN